jgi:hypothetical protein
VRNLDGVPAEHPGAGLAARAQPRQPQLPGEAHIRAPISQPRHLVIQRGRPDVRVVGKPGGRVGRERRQRIRRRADPDPRLALPLQVGTNSLAVTAKMASDRRHRPPASCQSMNLHIFSLCEHRAGAPSDDGLDTVRLEGAPAPVSGRQSRHAEAHQLGRFSDRRWGDSGDRRHSHRSARPAGRWPAARAPVRWPGRCRRWRPTKAIGLATHPAHPAPGQSPPSPNGQRADPNPGPTYPHGGPPASPT